MAEKLQATMPAQPGWCVARLNPVLQPASGFGGEERTRNAQIEPFWFMTPELTLRP